MTPLERKAKQLEALGYTLIDYRPDQGAIYQMPGGRVVSINKKGKVKPENQWYRKHIGE